MRLFRESAHRQGHAVEEEGLRRVLAAVAVRGGDQLFGLRHRQRREQIREHRLQRTAQPDVEEVRRVRVADVVVVRRIGRGDMVAREVHEQAHRIARVRAEPTRRGGRGGERHAPGVLAHVDDTGGGGFSTQEGGWRHRATISGSCVPTRGSRTSSCSRRWSLCTRPARSPCTYVLNDLLDRESRRRQHRHGSGHHRPPPPVGWNRSCGRCW